MKRFLRIIGSTFARFVVHVSSVRFFIISPKGVHSVKRPTGRGSRGDVSRQSAPSVGQRKGPDDRIQSGSE